MRNKIGVMQGRLVPKYKGRYQAHPIGYWKDEFYVAKELGLDYIEFILDFNDVDKNPLVYEGGVKEILAISEKTGVKVKTICADFFMEAPFHSTNEAVAKNSLSILQQLLITSEHLGITDIVIPCVDQSSLADDAAVERFVQVITPLLAEIENKNINLSLETDLDPQAFVRLLKRFDSNRITVNYDIGNSAALGYDPVQELDAYGDKISDIHIKDRMLSAGSVVLGEGNANFDRFFGKLKEFDYQGPFIMQVYRDDEGVEVFKQQLSWIKPYLENL
jgi:sugar phosphate isomerase/epimerase